MSEKERHIRCLILDLKDLDCDSRNFKRYFVEHAKELGFYCYTPIGFCLQIFTISIVASIILMIIH